jgi:hypothetical protein
MAAVAVKSAAQKTGNQMHRFMMALQCDTFLRIDSTPASGIFQRPEGALGLEE